MLMISLLMVVASISSPATITLTKDELDEFYDYMLGEDVMGREPPPSLGVIMTAERKVWHRFALRMSMDDTVSISKALNQIKTDVLFWTREV